jgi:hypothetical protein
MKRGAIVLLLSFAARSPVLEIASILSMPDE